MAVSFVMEEPSGPMAIRMALQETLTARLRPGSRADGKGFEGRLEPHDRCFAIMEARASPFARACLNGG